MPAFPWPLPLVGYAGLGNDIHELVNPLGYARQPVTIELTDELTDGGVQIASNLETLEWPTAQADWGTVSTVLVFGAPTGGKLLLNAILTSAGTPYSWGDYSVGLYSPTSPTPLVIHQYDRPRVSASAIEAWPVDGIPTGFGRGGWGRYAYGTAPQVYASVAAISLTFGRMYPCVAGTWAPGPFARAA
jgi:hypothetical protein